MQADGDRGDKYGSDDGQCDDPPGDSCLVFKIPQPFLHQVTGDGDGDDQCKQDQPDEGGRKQTDQLEQVCAQDFLDAEFLGPLPGTESNQCIQPMQEMKMDNSSNTLISLLSAPHLRGFSLVMLFKAILCGSETFSSPRWLIFILMVNLFTLLK